MTRGLTLGKYAPLHRGHQLVIETALAEMDETLVIVYDAPETTSVPLAVRSGWIRTLYPSVRVIEAWDGPTEVGYTAELMRAHERYVIDALGIGGITHFYSSEPYGEHMSRALGAIDRRVDEARRRVPVSARDVRRDPFAHREYVHPLVYRDLIVNVALLGAPSSGKTTLAERLAREFDTQWMPEYGREYWEKHQVDRRLEPRAARRDRGGAPRAGGRAAGAGEPLPLHRHERHHHRDLRALLPRRGRAAPRRACRRGGRPLRPHLRLRHRHPLRRHLGPVG